MKTTFYPMFLILFAFVYSNTVVAQTKNLDGNSYAIIVTQETGKKHHPRRGWPIDTLTFDTGKMVSRYMEERERFYPSSYSRSSRKIKSDSTFSFNYENNNPGGSFLRIKGTVHGNTIKGTVRWTASHKSRTRTYTFQGTLI